MLTEVLNQKPHLAAHGSVLPTYDKVADSLTRLDAFKLDKNLLTGKKVEEHLKTLEKKHAKGLVISAGATGEEEKALHHHLQRLSEQKEERAVDPAVHFHAAPAV